MNPRQCSHHRHAPGRTHRPSRSGGRPLHLWGEDLGRRHAMPIGRRCPWARYSCWLRFWDSDSLPESHVRGARRARFSWDGRAGPVDLYGHIKPNAEWHVQIYDRKLQERVRARLMIPFSPTGIPTVEPEYTVHRDRSVHGPYQPNAPDGTPYDETTVTWPTA